MEILYFEPTDEVTRAIERIRAAKQKQLALVLPQNSLILQSIVNLKLMQRIAKDAGKQITIVTIDKIGRNLASQIGLPVYGKIENGQPSGKVVQNAPQPVTSSEMRQKLMEETEEITTVTGIQVHRYDANDPVVQLQDRETGPAPDPSQPAHPLPDLGLLATPAEAAVEPKTVPTQTNWSGTASRNPTNQSAKRLYIIGAVIVILIIGWFLAGYYIPKTTVQITLKGEPKTVEQNVSAAVDGVARDIPLTILTATKTGSAQIPTTGTQNIGNKAAGTLTLVNNYSNTAVTVPAGSTLTTSDGKAFSLVAAVTIPGAEIAVQGATITVTKSGRADGQLQANAAGDQYNINGGQLTIAGITASSNNKVYGENPVTTGGSNVTKKIVADADITNLKAALTKQLTDGAVADATAKVGPDLVRLNELAQATLSGFAPSAPAGSEADTLTATGQVDARLGGYLKADLTAFISKAAIANTTGLSFTPTGDPALSAITPSADGKSVQFKVTQAGALAATVDVNALKKQLLGKSDRQARDLISKLPQYLDASILYKPSFFSHSVSHRAGQVTISVQYEGL